MARGRAPGRPGRPKKRLKASPHRRALYELASYLKCTVSTLEATLSAQEFHEWGAWLEAHRIGPRWDALRHAELLTALHNGALKRRDSRLWAEADFTPPDPWDDRPPEPDVQSAEAFMALLPRGPDT